MKRWMLKAILLISCNLAFNAATAQALKVGVVDMPRLVEEYSQIKGVQKSLQDEFAQKDEMLRNLSLEMKNSQDSIVTSALDDSERKENERSLLNLEREYARLASEFRQDYNLRRNEELYKMHKEITDTILEYAEDNQYDLIMESGMIFSADRLQVTDSILNKLREKLEK
ncbi:OmpH family outer membrane protein [Wohlfahrtiimonas chitiniclastica]|uniref:OmpH family outer membrane protein n=1 Tax=Wohlfahrtiimonas chitiniclastica TaxID=400946 RepID=UPI001FEEA901|nr:OmpH family outer membrane protein [Wohlfahrtiimonas chitiniclastica]